MKQEQRERITNKIIEALESGNIPWISPFDRQILPMNYLTKREYRGLNLLCLWMEAKLRGFTGNYWIGFKQANQLKGKIKKGASGTPIIVYCPHKKKVKDENTGVEEEVISSYFKSDYVFNLYSQVEGIEFDEHKPSYKPLEKLDELITAYDIKIVHSGERAFYKPSGDYINMPLQSKFKTQEGYYATLTHELIHSTMHHARCGRDIDNTDEARALEELTAELGAAFLCAEFGIKSDMQNTSAYIQSWIKALKDDVNYIFKASHLASNAVDYLLSLSKENNEAA